MMNGRKRSQEKASPVARWVGAIQARKLLWFMVSYLSQGEEKEGEAEGEDSDEDDGFFVPHGYLSNDEGDCSDSGDPIPGPGEDVIIYLLMCQC